MRPIFLLLLFAAGLLSCSLETPPIEKTMDNPFNTPLNAPIPYAEVTAEDITEYAQSTLDKTNTILDEIKRSAPTFENVFIPFDAAMSELSKASSNCFMHYWVSPDSASRARGLDGNQLLDSLNTRIYSDSALYQQMIAFRDSDGYSQLTGPRKRYVDDEILAFEHSGVRLESASLQRYRDLVAELNELTSSYSTNMNTANATVVLDEEGARGLTENFKAPYRQDDGTYVIPVIPATRKPVLDNAVVEATRKAYYLKYFSRAADKNLKILDSLRQKRYEIGQLMGNDSYAEYVLSLRMAKNPANVWDFINDLLDRSRQKAIEDHERLKARRNSMLGTDSDAPVKPWDIGYYNNEILKNEYLVDHEEIRKYFPMEKCLTGMMEIYQELLGLTFRKVDDASVWHEEVDLYEVYEGEDLKGRFYLDLFPRPNKESWFYGVPLTSGRMTNDGYEVPVSMLLGNFTRPTESVPSLVSHAELNTLFHEFGHIMDAMSYHGEFASQASSKRDFVEAMSQIFENWIWDYDILSSLSEHYETGETLPRETVEKMNAAKNVGSGIATQMSLRNCVYDMTLYDKYDPADPTDTDQIWRDIDEQMPFPMYVEGSHQQSCWIHINTHPVYYYGYLWSEVYAQDMFTVFEELGLRDTATGVRYRNTILANGTQHDIEGAVEEFLGRPSNNEAYIKSLGLE